MISEEDEQNLVDAKPNSVTKLKSLPPNVEPDKFIRPLGMLPVDPALYDTAPMEKDMLMAGGMQEANIGPAGKDVTATVGTIAEQSRMTMLSSNVDDLDGFLSRIAKAGVELILRGMSVQTAQRIAGIGAVLPEDDIDEYLNEINIKIQAASSGRPNRAMGISNAQQLMPILMQAGANPAAIVEELVKRMDDTLDIDNFFPLIPALMDAPATGAVSSPQTAAPQKSGAGQRTISPQQNAGGVSVNQQQQLAVQN
jgi:ribosomal protein L12E/L44/L45/RPP1/RPP2